MLIPLKSLGRILRATTLGLIVMAAPLAHGGSFQNVQIVGLWSSPLLSGNVVSRDPNSGIITSTLIDNTATAVYSISGGTLQWGSGSTAPPTASSLSFAGKSYQDLPLNTPHTELGTLTYVNGESDTNSLIFGATLTLSIPTTSIVALPVQLGIVSTSNFHMCAVCDSDYFSFSPEVILDKTGNALEGDTVSFILYGSVVGDPEIRLTDIALAPGQTGGFVGDGVGTPELGTFSLFGGGLVITLSSRLRLKWRKWTNAS